MVDLKRIYFRLLLTMAHSQLSDVFVSETNLPHLPQILQTATEVAKDPAGKYMLLVDLSACQPLPFLHQVRVWRLRGLACSLLCLCPSSTAWNPPLGDGRGLARRRPRVSA